MDHFLNLQDLFTKTNIDIEIMHREFGAG